MPLLTRDRIVDAALAFVEQHGHEPMSLRKLAGELGVTAPALYDHVRSKDELLRSVAARGYQALGLAYDSDLPRAIERVRARALTYVRFAQQHPELFRVMFMFRPAAVQIEADNELAAASSLFERGTADLVRAIADGDLVDRDPTHLGLTLWAAMHGVAHVALLAPPVADDVAADVIDTMLAGLRPTD